MPLIDPHRILTDPARHRTELFTADLEESIERLGQLQPIVCRETPEGALFLIAGGRRLQACKNLNRQIEYTTRADFDETTSKCAELEENLKRDDLPWPDRARAINSIHELYKSQNSPWAMENTAQRLGVTVMVVFRHLKVAKYAEKHPNVYALASLEQAMTTVDRATDRIIASHIEAISLTAREAFSKGKPRETTGGAPIANNNNDDNNNNNNNDNDDDDNDDNDANTISPPNDVDSRSSFTRDTSSNESIHHGASPTNSIICESFLSWAPSYSGPKFNFIHCDFPYGMPMSSHSLWDTNQYENNPKIFFDLTDCLITNFDNFASYSCHVMFWFAAKYYAETLTRLQSLGLEVIIPPMIWYHSDNRGMAPWVKGVMQPRRVYDMAFIASRGGRMLLKNEVVNLHGAPLVSRPIHSTQKPEPMLEHFFSMVVDKYTDLLDPTCGSASALCAAEKLGARSVLGLELDPQHAKAAQNYLNQRRDLRKLSKS